MMTEEMMKNMHAMMSSGGQVMSHPVAKGAALAASGFAAGRSLLGASLLRNPLTLLAAGVAAGVVGGFLAFKYQKEIVDGLAKAGGMGKDFALHQKENLADLMAEMQEKVDGAAPVADQPADVPADPVA